MSDPQEGSRHETNHHHLVECDHPLLDKLQVSVTPIYFLWFFSQAQQQDPERSLSPGQQPLTSPLSPSESALQSIGALSLGPANLTAQAHAAEPLPEGIDPRESLSLLGEIDLLLALQLMHIP